MRAEGLDGIEVETFRLSARLSQHSMKPGFNAIPEAWGSFHRGKRNGLRRGNESILKKIHQKGQVTKLLNITIASKIDSIPIVGFELPMRLQQPKKCLDVAILSSEFPSCLKIHSVLNWQLALL